VIFHLSAAPSRMTRASTTALATERRSTCAFPRFSSLFADGKRGFIPAFRFSLSLSLFSETIDDSQRAITIKFHASFVGSTALQSTARSLCLSLEIILARETGVPFPRGNASADFRFLPVTGSAFRARHPAAHCALFCLRSRRRAYYSYRHEFLFIARAGSLVVRARTRALRH